MDEDIKEVLLNLLLTLDRVCNKYNLRYYIAFGTCLGAIRHKGFIPWDHDIDVLMPIADVKKLMELQDEFGERYFIQTHETDPEFGSISCKLRDSYTTCIWNDYKNCRFNQGLNIDIYPFYYAPNSKFGLLLNIWRSHMLKVLTIGDMPIHQNSMVCFFKNIIQRVYKGEKREKAIKKIKDKLESVKDGNEILDYYGEDISLFSAITYPKEWFAIPQKVEFEGYLVNAPTEPEKYMKRRYGDYMTLPPIEKRVDGFGEPGAIIDAHKSFKAYYKEMDES